MNNMRVIQPHQNVQFSRKEFFDKIFRGFWYVHNLAGQVSVLFFIGSGEKLGQIHIGVGTYTNPVIRLRSFTLKRFNTPSPNFLRSLYPLAARVCSSDPLIKISLAMIVIQHRKRHFVYQRTVLTLTRNFRCSIIMKKKAFTVMENRLQCRFCRWPFTRSCQMCIMNNGHD